MPDVQIGQMWLRVLERRAKLYGLDLERSAGAYRRDDRRGLRLRSQGYEALYGDAIEVDAEELLESRGDHVLPQSSVRPGPPLPSQERRAPGRADRCEA